MAEGHSRLEKLTIIGAGPVGSLLATRLALRGHEVEVFERRPDMRREVISAGRSINLAVSTRGLYALREIGLEAEVLDQSVPMRGRMMHSATGQLTFQRYGRDDSECIHSISRGGLNKLLMTQAEKTGRVKFHFNRKLAAVDFDRRELELEGEERIGFSRVIGTDGSASALRAELMKAPGALCSQSQLEYGYKELHIPAGIDGKFLFEKHALHIWPRGTFMLIALPNFDGSFTCTLFLPFEGPVSFAQLSTPEAVTKFFEEYFSDALALIPHCADKFFENPTGFMVTVKASPWNRAGEALLLGDAAHAIVPFFGQGMNCGFEDCTELLYRLDSTSPCDEAEWATLFGEFSRDRKPDTDAIADMAVDNFFEMRDKVGSPRFLLEKGVEKILSDKFSGEYVSRYALVTFSRVPYRLAHSQGLIQDQILAELCSDIEKPEDVDLNRAAELIRSRLASQKRN